jgi:hypothetical protein
MTNPTGSRLRHGHRRKDGTTPEYRAWMKMRGRCNNLDNANYGGRGIVVCPRWDVYENFLADMGPKPSRGHSLDRIDPNGDYEPGNCRWATATTQQRNRRDNRWFVVDGVRATLAEHCARTGVKYATAHLRLKRGASIEVAICAERPAYGSLKGALNITIERLEAA